MSRASGMFVFTTPSSQKRPDQLILVVSLHRQPNLTTFTVIMAPS